MYCYLFLLTLFSIWVRGHSISPNFPVAAAEGHTRVASLLLQYKAPVNKVDHSGNTPLDEAIKNNQIAVITLLKKLKATSNRCYESAVLLCAAAAANDLDTIKHMVENGADINVVDYDQRTPLHIAASMVCLL